MLIRPYLKKIPRLLFAAILLLFSYNAFSQELTRIRGTVLDETTGKGLPYVNISFDGTIIGTVSDGDGKFYIESTEATELLKASFIGYEPTYKPVSIGVSQTITVILQEQSIELESVVISSKKLRYRNKDNPAVSIIKKILDHKDSNRPESLDYFEYEKYEKVELDLNNISEDFKNKRSLKSFQLIFDFVDTSEVNGKAYLPLFLRETSSRVYYQKNPQKLIEHKKGQKMTGFENYFDNQGISSMIDKMYQEVDIYDNNVSVLTQKFISPIATIGPLTYKYYIADTLVIEGEKLFKVAFRPRNENSLTFVGNMFVTTDSAFAVKKISMRLSKKTNLNFVEDLYIDQEFEKNDFGTYDIVTDKISIDFNLLTANGLGMLGKRTVSYRDLTYNKKREDSLYKGLSKAIADPDMENRSDEFWAEARHMELSKAESGVFEMMEQVEELPAFQQIMDALILLTVGYLDIGRIEIGPVGSFYSWNQIEGYRVRLGARTTPKFSEKYLLEGYGAYGLKDEEWKYAGRVTRYFNKNNSLSISYEKEIQNPGQNLQFASNDNIFLSLRRGVNDKRFYKYSSAIEYTKRLKDGLSFSIGGQNIDTEPGGVLDFTAGENIRSEHISSTERHQQRINTTEANLTFRFAPNEQYYEGKSSLIPIINKYPIFTVKYDHGFDGIFNADYGYDRLSFGVFKRTFIAPLGYFDAEIEARKLWGQVPFPLLNIPQANQTFSYLKRAYNLMNFLEFVSDEYVSLQLEQNFNGFIMNKVPLVKKMKLRSIVTFKGIYGQLSSINDPSLVENSNLPALPSNVDGTQATYPMSTYIETSIGIGNIFKFFRLDVVKRWTQLERNDIAAGYNLRARFKVEF